MPISTTPVHQATGNGTASPLTVTITAPTSTNALVLCVNSKGSASPRSVSTVVTTNVVWTFMGADSQSLETTEMWRGAVGGSAGTSVAITFSGTIANAAANVTEWSGISAVGATAVTAKAASSTAGSTGAYSTTEANDLVVACLGYNNGTAPSVQPGGSWQNLTFSNSSTACGVQGNYIVPAAIGSQSATWTIGSANWVSVIGSFKNTPVAQSLSASMATMAGTLTLLTLRGLSASMATMDAAVTKLTGMPLTASMNTMGGAIAKLVSILLSASMANMAGSLAKTTGHGLSASMATMAGTLNRTVGVAFIAAMNTMAGTLFKNTGKQLIASMATMAGALLSGSAHFVSFAASMATMAGTLLENFISGVGGSDKVRIGTIYGSVTNETKADIGGGGF